MRRSGDTFGRIQYGLVWSPRLKSGLIKARFTDSPFVPGECKEATARTPPLQLSTVGGGAVKNQFFADKHDYFKYDLWLEVAEKLKEKGIQRLAFIPMLTPVDSSKEGRKVSYPEGKRRRRLYGFLQFCLGSKRRSITRLREFLCDEPFEYHPYRDEDDKGFQNGSWDAYFNAIPHEWLRDAAILMDPDIGLEPKEAPSDKHVTYKNVGSVLSRCSGNWVVLVVQFLSKGNAHVRERQLQEKLEKLEELHKQLPPGLANLGSIVWVAEKGRTGLPGELALFAIGASSQTSIRLQALLRRYKKAHDLLYGHS
jgi:hypothetical protein